MTSMLSAQISNGSLATKNGQWILRLSGTPYEMGYQHGKLLREEIERNIATYLENPPADEADRAKATSFAQALPNLLSFVPKRFQEEMKGIADGSGIPLKKILTLNLFPEMFHCSGITASQEATIGGALYHARILDYSVGKKLQETAVLMFVKPNEGASFVNVSYAGFIGSVTGMNSHKIAMGEIGGDGYGNWNGIPMSFLIRDILERATTLEEARNILTSSPRTCEYYYIVSDGKSNQSFGCYATLDQIHFIEPGTTYAMAASTNPEKAFLTPSSTSPYQTLLLQEDKTHIGLIHQQLPHCVMMTGFKHPERYPIMAERMEKNYGKIDVQKLMEIIKSPVSRPSNLHNAIFAPAELKLWVSHAGPNDEPACDQPYFEFSFEELSRKANG